MNRWAFSHLREVLPTAAIQRDPAGFQPLAVSDEFSSDFSVSLEGQEQSIDEIAAAQFIDGLLVLKDGKIVAERYYGQLALIARICSIRSPSQLLVCWLGSWRLMR